MKKDNIYEFSLYIDIEGFGDKFEDGGKQSFINLTNDLYSLGQKFFEKLSIIQFGGDGFLIKEILSYQNSIRKFIDIAAALLQIILIRGNTGRVKISHGYMSDIKSSYSEEIKKELYGNNQYVLKFNKNIMLLNPVIGTSIINCYKLNGPKGPLLLVDKDLEEKIIHEKVPYKKINSDKYNVLWINWINHKNENTELILKHLNLNNKNIETNLKSYIDKNDLPEEWKKSALELIE